MPCRRSCGNSWSYSWSTQPTVQYYCPLQNQQAVNDSGKSYKSPSGHPPVSPEDFDGDYHEYGRYLHNWYRRRHGSPPVSTLDRLNKAGDAYCAKLAAMRTLMHSSGLDYNENLFMTTDTSISKKEAVRQACKGWYDEIHQYSFNSPGFSMATGHFTAMIFKGVSQFGVGCWEANGCIVVAGCYKPHANMQGQFASNVLPFRNVEDTDNEESEEEKPAKAENVKHGKLSAQPEQVPNDDNVHPTAKDDFTQLSDSNGTIGWEELNDWLNKCIKVAIRFDGFDKLISTLLISLATIPQGEKQRINLNEFGVILKCVESVLDAYGEYDRDGSGTLDPFEMKDALNSAGLSITYKIFLALQSTLGGEGSSMVMNFRSYLLAFLLLSKLQAVQLARAKTRPNGGLIEDFSLKEWIQEQINI